MEKQTDTATFQTRTLRPNSGEPIWFNELTTVEVVCNAGDGIVARMPDFALSAMGPTETEALRALGDVIREATARLVGIQTPQLDRRERRLKRRLLAAVDIIASGIVPPVEFVWTTGKIELRRGQPLLRHDMEERFGPVPLTTEQFVRLLNDFNGVAFVKVAFDTSDRPPRQFVNPQVVEIEPLPLDDENS